MVVVVVVVVVVVAVLVATLGSNLGFQLCLKSCIALACKWGHEVVLLSRCDNPPTHPLFDFSQSQNFYGSYEPEVWWVC